MYIDLDSIKNDYPELYSILTREDGSEVSIDELGTIIKQVACNSFSRETCPLKNSF